jgi:hypothetical protein
MVTSGMRGSGVFLCALPENFAGDDPSLFQLDLASLQEDFLINERRLRKDIDPSRERKRHLVCSDRLEYLGMILPHILSNGRFLPLVLPQEYVEHIDWMIREFPEEAQRMRLGSVFFSSKEAWSHADQFSVLVRRCGLSWEKSIRARLEFFRRAARERCHVVEYVSTALSVHHRSFLEDYNGLDLKSKGLFRVIFERLWNHRQRIEKAVLEPKDSALFLESDHEAVTIREKEKDGADFIQAEMLAALAAARSFSGLEHYPHRDVVEALNRLVYADASGDDTKSSSLRMVYSDGSGTRPFPLFALNRGSGKESGEVASVRYGMLSQRHPEMDAVVDLYWFRNQEVQMRKGMAEKEELCYDQSQQLFRELRQVYAQVRMYFYQTGLIPAIVGFYRALADELMESRDDPWIEVIPVCYVEGKYQEGTPWN